MSLSEYFLTLQHWSISGFIFLVAILWVYFLKLKTSLAQKLFFVIGVSSIYIVLGSPLAEFKAYGLHSIAMLQQIILLMVAPTWIIRGLPKSVFNYAFIKTLSIFKCPKKYMLLTWLAASVVMWGGHYLNVVIMASKNGIAFSGFHLTNTSWLANVPYWPFYMLFFVTGFLFAVPVFHPEKSKRLHPVISVIYLFTACVSCSVLGLYITFMASSPSSLNHFIRFTDPYHIISITPKTDQEIAGLLMWVPGCILYVVSSMGLLLPWYDSTFSSFKKENEANHHLEKTY